MSVIVSALAAFGACAFGGFAAGPAAAAQGCALVGAPYVSVQVVDPGPRITSTKSLDQINAMAGSHGLSKEGFRVLGMTQIDLQSGMQVEYQAQPTRGMVCVRVNKVKASFGLKRHYVHVPREYPRGSCQYRVVMRHEMAHVDVNRRTVRKYAQIMKNDIRSVLRKNGAVPARTMADGQKIQHDRIQAVIDRIGTEFNAELKRLHGDIDAPNSRYAATDQCRSW